MHSNAVFTKPRKRVIYMAIFAQIKEFLVNHKWKYGVMQKIAKYLKHL